MDQPNTQPRLRRSLTRTFASSAAASARNIQSNRRDSLSRFQVHLANEQSFKTALFGVELEKPRPDVARIEGSEELSGPFLLRLKVNTFAISLGLSSQAQLWGALCNSSIVTAAVGGGNGIPGYMQWVFWVVAVALLSITSLAYMAKAVLYWGAVQREWAHPVRSFFFFVPVLSTMTLMLGRPSWIDASEGHSPEVPLVAFIVLGTLVFLLEMAIYRRWLFNITNSISRANPAYQLAVVGNFILASMGARVGDNESVVLACAEISHFFFSVGIIYYLLVFFSIQQNSAEIVVHPNARRTVVDSKNSENKGEPSRKKNVFFPGSLPIESQLPLRRAPRIGTPPPDEAERDFGCRGNDHCDGINDGSMGMSAGVVSRWGRIQAPMIIRANGRSDIGDETKGGSDGRGHVGTRRHRRMESPSSTLEEGGKGREEWEDSGVEISPARSHDAGYSAHGDVKASSEQHFVSGGSAWPAPVPLHSPEQPLNTGDGPVDPGSATSPLSDPSPERTSIAISQGPITAASTAAASTASTVGYRSSGRPSVANHGRLPLQRRVAASPGAVQGWSRREESDDVETGRTDNNNNGGFAKRGTVFPGGSRSPRALEGGRYDGVDNPSGNVEGANTTDSHHALLPAQSPMPSGQEQQPQAVLSPALHPIYFLFIAPPSAASISWSSISGSFDLLARSLYFVAAWLYVFFVFGNWNFLWTESFSVAWWAYSFPSSTFALATIMYGQELASEGVALGALVLGVASTTTVLFVLCMTIRAAIEGKLFGPDPVLSVRLV